LDFVTIVKEVECKSALSKSGLPGLDYALNPYRGCTHKCVYCYAPAIVRETRPWGEFLDVKANIPQILEKQLKKAKKGVVGISTVTDPYMAEEAKYGITRKCLETLLKHDFPISIQTKSALVLRDLDILEKFGRCEVGFTITTIDECERRKYEGGSSVTERMNAIGTLKGRGIKTWAFLGPILPGITDRDNGLQATIESLGRLRVDYLLADRLRLKPGTWIGINSFIRKEHPELANMYEDLFMRGGHRGYYDKIFTELRRLCAKNEIEFRMAFGEDGAEVMK
jgi:DNA repair photolyase